MTVSHGASSISLAPRARVETRCLTGPLAAVACSGDTSSARPCSQEHSFGSVRHKPLTFSEPSFLALAPGPKIPLPSMLWECGAGILLSSVGLTWQLAHLTSDAQGHRSEVSSMMPECAPGSPLVSRATGFLCSGYLITYDVLSYFFCFCYSVVAVISKESLEEREAGCPSCLPF